ncbi:MAG: HAD-IIA family hydrolase [Anaerolineae bacterium]|nr:HAD-IIA family hydrolase [Anaerolineae bacterium]
MRATNDNGQSNIAAVVLAAGASTRFGQPKQLLDWGGKPLVAHVAEVALAAGFARVIVVLGYQAGAVRAALDTRPVQTVMNWRWKEGMSTSVYAGLVALPLDTEAAIFLHCDQPLVTPDLLRALVARFRESGAPIVYPSLAGQQRTPVLFAAELFPELAAVSGDEGGRALIARYAHRAAMLPVSDARVLADIDTPADYEQLHSFSLQSAPSRGEERLRSIRHLIVDMDGVLWHGDHPLPGLQEFFSFLYQKQIGFMLVTNNSSKTPDQYMRKLAGFGVEVTTANILTSAQATAAYLAGIAPPGSRIYAIGEDGVREALVDQGFVIADESGTGASFVVVGWDRHLTWDKLATAALLIQAGAGFIGTNPDVNYPTVHGRVPGNGAQLAALQVTTGVSPIVVGKPEVWLFREALRRMNAQPEHTAVLGDRLDTDILGGVRAGLTTILVLSGISTQAELAASPVKPDLVYTGIAELTQVWQRLL